MDENGNIGAMYNKISKYTWEFNFSRETYGVSKIA